MNGHVQVVFLVLLDEQVVDAFDRLVPSRVRLFPLACQPRAVREAKT